MMTIAYPFGKSNALLNGGKSKERYWQAFLIAFGVSFLFFLPFLIIDKGIFFYYGDYNVQQVPFYMHAHEAIRSGNIGWDWLTDLGANFIGSYSFYLLGSPFFWLTLPFPTAALPYLMAPLLCLKFGIASVTSYAFIRRFTKTTEFALMGGLLYSLSGFMVYNIFFNHFHEVVAFFPLLLIALEEAVVNNRKGFFALAVGLSAFVNYYFFFGQVVFVFIYFTIRMQSPDFDVDLKKFFWLGLEAVLGVLLAMGLLLPSVLTIIGNGRTSSYISGWNMLFYSDEQRYGLILQSLFFPPDIPARPNFFPDSNAKWSSVAAYLPMVSMAGVIAFLKDRKNHWMSRVLKVSLVMALIPVLNSAFSAFNYSYYARWFYMPILVMALMTVRTLEDKKSSIQHGIKWTLFFTLVFAAIGILPAWQEEEYVFGALPQYPERFWTNVVISLAGILILSALVAYFWKKRKKLARFAVIGVCIITLTYSITSISWGKSASDTTKRLVDKGLNFSQVLDIPSGDEEFFRVDVYDGMDNWPMYWGKPTIQAFHSVVPGSIMDFYDSIGVSRVVASRPEQKHKGLRTLTSVKYLLFESSKEKGEKKADTEGYTFYDEQGGMRIYTNDNYVPMGFAYSYYMDGATFEDVVKENRDRLMVKAVLLTDEQIARHQDILQPLPEEEAKKFTAEDLKNDADKLRKETAYSFVTDKKGFTAKTSFSKENLLFFSVPYEDGWTAAVNGQAAEIERVNSGFMAVRVPAGEAEIRFDYKTPGLAAGILISCFALLCIAAIFIVSRKYTKLAPVFFKVHKNADKEALEKYDDYELLDDLPDGEKDSEKEKGTEIRIVEGQLSFDMLQDIKNEQELQKDSQDDIGTGEEETK